MRPSSSPARILVVAPQPFFALRGTPLNVLAMLRTLCAAGHDVSTSRPSPPGTLVPIAGLTYHRAMRVPGASHVPIGFSLAKLANDASLALLVARLLAARRFDVVHAVEESLFFTFPLARLRGVPVIADVDSCLSDQLGAGGTLVAPPRGGWHAAPKASHCAAPTRDPRCAAHSPRWWPPARRRCASRRSRIVPPRGADPGPSIRRRSPSCVASGIRGVRRSRSTRGTSPPYQGLGLLFDALPTMASLAPSARLLVVGGEPAEVVSARAALARHGLDDRVRFAGELRAGRTHGGVHGARRRPRVATKHGENTPLKLYAYMASGRSDRRHRPGDAHPGARRDSAVLAPRHPTRSAPHWPRCSTIPPRTRDVRRLPVRASSASIRAQRSRGSSSPLTTACSPTNTLQRHEQHVAARPRQQRVERREGTHHGERHPEPRPPAPAPPVTPSPSPSNALVPCCHADTPSSAPYRARRRKSGSR